MRDDAWWTVDWWLWALACVGLFVLGYYKTDLRAAEIQNRLDGMEELIIRMDERSLVCEPSVYDYPR